MGTAGIIVVGTGQAGFQVAASLRDEGFNGTITLVGDEPGLPYQRPPLSKAYLAGKDPQVELRPAAFYAEHRIAVLTPERVSGIDREGRRVHLASGASLPYAHLVLATGARARMPAVPGIGLQGVLPLRTLADAEKLLAGLRRGGRVVVVGGGFIGLEVAVIARAMKLDVQVIEFSERVLKRAVSAEVAAYLTEAQARQGVRFAFKTGVAAFVGEAGRVTGVETTHGDSLPADLVVVGVGVEPQVELASAAGLAVHDGILVDAELGTADPFISAIGDCARYPASFCDTPVRLESVQNAVDHARCLAASLTGRRQPYDKVPWFWSDQGDNRLQIAGVAEPGDSAVVRGDPASGKFSVFRLRHGHLRAVESVNSAADHMAARKLLAARVAVTPDQAADTTLKLTSLIAN